MSSSQSDCSVLFLAVSLCDARHGQEPITDPFKEHAYELFLEKYPLACGFSLPLTVHGCHGCHVRPRVVGYRRSLVKIVAGCVLGMEGCLPVPLDRDIDSRTVPRLNAAKTWAGSHAVF